MRGLTFLSELEMLKERKGRFKNAQHIAGSGWKTNALREKPKKIQSDKWKTNSLFSALGDEETEEVSLKKSEIYFNKTWYGSNGK